MEPLWHESKKDDFFVEEEGNQKNGVKVIMEGVE